MFVLVIEIFKILSSLQWPPQTKVLDSGTATQMIPHGPATTSDHTVTQQIHQRTQAKTTNRLRQDLLGLGKVWGWISEKERKKEKKQDWCSYLDLFRVLWVLKFLFFPKVFFLFVGLYVVDYLFVSSSLVSLCLFVFFVLSILSAFLTLSVSLSCL